LENRKRSVIRNRPDPVGQILGRKGGGTSRKRETMGEVWKHKMISKSGKRIRKAGRKNRENNFTGKGRTDERGDAATSTGGPKKGEMYAIQERRVRKRQFRDVCNTSDCVTGANRLNAALLEFVTAHAQT